MFCPAFEHFFLNLTPRAGGPIPQYELLCASTPKQTSGSKFFLEKLQLAYNTTTILYITIKYPLQLSLSLLTLVLLILSAAVQYSTV